MSRIVQRVGIAGLMGGCNPGRTETGIDGISYSEAYIRSDTLSGWEFEVPELGFGPACQADIEAMQSR